jgi:hypothetical protein
VNIEVDVVRAEEALNTGHCRVMQPCAAGYPAKL